MPCLTVTFTCVLQWSQIVTIQLTLMALSNQSRVHDDNIFTAVRALKSKFATSNAVA